MRITLKLDISEPKAKGWIKFCGHLSFCCCGLKNLKIPNPWWHPSNKVTVNIQEALKHGGVAGFLLILVLKLPSYSQ